MIDTQESMTAKLCSFARAYHSNFGKQKYLTIFLPTISWAKRNMRRSGS
ncbi:MAG: hypothetical protein ACLR23_23890 [Clostridia bacterium]